MGPEAHRVGTSSGCVWITPGWRDSESVISPHSSQGDSVEMSEVTAVSAKPATDHGLKATAAKVAVVAGAIHRKGEAPVRRGRALRRTSRDWIERGSRCTAAHGPRGSRPSAVMSPGRNSGAFGWGIQFRSRSFVELLRHHGLTGSMGRVGACADNAAMSFFSLLQKNVLDSQRWLSRQELRLATWIERAYNRR